MSTWSKELVIEFNSLIEKCVWAGTFPGTIQKCDRLHLLESFFEKSDLHTFPGPIQSEVSAMSSDNSNFVDHTDVSLDANSNIPRSWQYLTFEMGFNPYWLWDQVVKINDAQVLEFLVSKNMPLPGDAVFNEFKQYSPSFDFGLYGNFDFLYNSKVDAYSVSDVEASETRDFLLAAFRSGFLDTSDNNLYLGVRILIVAAEDSELLHEALKKYNFGVLLEHTTRYTNWWSRFFSVNKMSYLPSLANWFSKQDAVYGTQKRKWNEVPVCILPGTSVETLELASKFDINFVDVSVSCGRDVLLWAASHGIAPESDVMESGMFGTRFSNSSEAAMQKISQSLDYDVIKAFLSAGHLKEIDVECARRANRQDLLKLYGEFGVSDPCSTIYYGSSYVCESGEVVIPEGVRKIEKFAFRASALGKDVAQTGNLLRLSSSLEVIEEGAFYGVPFDRVIIPSQVTVVRRGAFYGSEVITIYDSLYAVPEGQKRRSPQPDKCDPLAPYRDQTPDYPSVPVGFIGASLPSRAVEGLSYDESSLRNFTIEVRSAKTNKVLYRVWMPLAEVNEEYRNFFLSDWGSHASFGFGHLDKEFDALPQKVKFRVALDRLRWHIRLKADIEERYCAFVTKYRQSIARDCCIRGSVEDLSFLMECSQKALNISKLMQDAEDLSYPETICSYLLALK